MIVYMKVRTKRQEGDEEEQNATHLCSPLGGTTSPFGGCTILSTPAKKARGIPSAHPMLRKLKSIISLTLKKEQLFLP
jgi:hypothetical protein